MSRFEIRILLTVLALLLAAACSQVMTYNGLTGLGVASICALVTLSILAEISGRLLHRDWVAWLGPVFAALCLVIALLFACAPARPESGILVDTSQAWERYEGARTSRDQPGNDHP